MQYKFFCFEAAQSFWAAFFFVLYAKMNSESWQVLVYSFKTNG